MSDGWTLILAAGMILVVVFGITSCSAQMDACKAAGGTPVYEYKNLPSCWSADGRRMFPHVN